MLMYLRHVIRSKHSLVFDKQLVRERYAEGDGEALASEQENIFDSKPQTFFQLSSRTAYAEDHWYSSILKKVL